VASSEADAHKKLAELRKTLRAAGDLPTGRETVAQWMNVWYETIAVKKIRPRTAATYRGYIDNHIIPTLGKLRLDKLTPAHVRRLHQAVEDAGLSSTTALQVHHILSSALKIAEREGRVARNAANLTDAPRKEPTRLKVLSTADGREVLRVTENDRLGARWWVALLVGARQGEALGIELDRVGDSLDLSWQLQRLRWEHGCSTPCGAKRGTDCPDRRVVVPRGYDYRHLTGGLYLTRPKSRAGWRIIPLMDPLRPMIERRVVEAEGEPNPHGLLFTADQKKTNGGGRQHMLLPLDGSPIDPAADNEAWHIVLQRADVPDVRLHDARHTTASLLLEANVPGPIIQLILGHSTFAMSQAYMNIDVRQVGSALSSAGQLIAPR
jgi:integrase